MEEVVPLGEEVLEVGKRTENRGTARIRRFVVETPIERQVTLQSERVVVERRRPVSDKVTGEILTEVTVEIVERQPEFSTRYDRRLDAGHPPPRSLVEVAAEPHEVCQVAVQHDGRARSDLRKA